MITHLLVEILVATQKKVNKLLNATKISSMF